MYSTNSTNSIKQCRNTSGQQVVRKVIFSVLCTAGAVKRLVLGWITSNLTTWILAEIEEFHRIEMRIRTATGNSGIKQLCSFLIQFFASLPY